MTENKDTLYFTTHTEIERFKFDARVADVFQDMISRSVPGYLQILELLPTLVRNFAQSHGQYYDLGCSLGAGMLAMAKGMEDNKRKIIGIDNSESMLAQAKHNLNKIYSETHKNSQQFELLCQDIQNSEIDNASMVLMNFTLQFVPLADRNTLVEKIYRGLYKGGVLVLSEKLKFNEPRIDQTLISIHHQYKADQGYSQLEIAQKRDAIENVLIPETLNAHQQRLTDAGFSIVTPWIQNLQFVSILAIK